MSVFPLSPVVFSELGFVLFSVDWDRFVFLSFCASQSFNWIHNECCFWVIIWTLWQWQTEMQHALLFCFVFQYCCLRVLKNCCLKVLKTSGCILGYIFWFWTTPGWKHLRISAGSQRKLLTAPVLSSSSDWPWTKAILTGHLSTKPWVLKPRCWALAVEFLKGRTINLDLLAKFQSAFSCCFGSSGSSFILILPSLIPAAAMGHFLAYFSRTCRFPSSGLNSASILEKHTAAKRCPHSLNHMLG